MQEAQTTSQKVFSHAIEANLAKELFEEAETVREKARLNSVSMKHSGDWLFAAPVRALGLHLRKAHVNPATIQRHSRRSCCRMWQQWRMNMET